MEQNDSAFLKSLLSEGIIKMDRKIINYDHSSKIVEHNGAVFAVRHVPGAHKFTMCALVQVGGYNDGGCGTAHFVEHLCTGHTKNFPNNAADKFLKDRGGESNASTSVDNTKYYCSVLTGYEPDAIAAISDFVCRPCWTGEDVQKQKEIILGEWAEDEMDFSGVLYKKISSAAYENGGGKRSIIGTLKTISRMTLERAVEFYEKEYCADRLIVVMEGDFDAERLLKAAKNAFDLPRGPQAVEIPQTEFTPSTKIYQSDERATKAAIIIPSLTSAAPIKEQVEMQLFHELLFDSIGHVSSELRGAKNLVYSIGVKASAHERDRGFDAVVFDGLPERIPIITEAFCKSVNEFMESPDEGLFRTLVQKYISDKMKSVIREPEIEAKRMAQRISNQAIIYPRDIFIKTAEALNLSDVVERGWQSLKSQGLSVCYMGQYRDDFFNHDEIMEMLGYKISHPIRNGPKNWKWLGKELAPGDG